MYITIAQNLTTTAVHGKAELPCMLFWNSHMPCIWESVYFLVVRVVKGYSSKLTIHQFASRLCYLIQGHLFVWGSSDLFKVSLEARQEIGACRLCLILDGIADSNADPRREITEHAGVGEIKSTRLLTRKLQHTYDPVWGMDRNSKQRLNLQTSTPIE